MSVHGARVSQRGVLAAGNAQNGCVAPAGNAQSIRDVGVRWDSVDVTEHYRTLPGNGGRALLRYSTPRWVTVMPNRPVFPLLGCEISQPVMPGNVQVLHLYRARLARLEGTL
jgi:hypothetical protein